MKNINKEKVILIIVSGLTVLMGFIYDQFFCFSKYYQDCALDEYRLIIFEPIVLLAIFVFIVSIFIFFISEKIFKKWSVFAVTWLIIDVLLIAWAPVTSSYYFGGPTKESVSIWMGTLFVIISILMFVILTIKERKSLKK